MSFTFFKFKDLDAEEVKIMKDHAETYYLRYKAGIDKLVKRTKSAIAPESVELYHPEFWERPHWRWFLQTILKQTLPEGVDIVDGTSHNKDDDTMVDEEQV